MLLFELSKAETSQAAQGQRSYVLSRPHGASISALGPMVEATALWTMVRFSFSNLLMFWNL